MANTYTQLHIQFVFAVKFRAAVIHPSWKYRLYTYITGIIQHHGHTMIAINGMPDHIHLLVGMRPDQSIAELMQKTKQGSSKWINTEQLTVGRFAWQEGYGAFSYSKSQLPAVIQYIERQEEHHQKQSFTDEYQRFLDRAGVTYDQRYLLKTPD